MKYKVLVNKENKIKDKFLSKIELITTKDVDDLDVQVEKETYNAYLKLKEFLATKNVIIGIASAYRSKEYQQEIYDSFVEEYGKDYADKVVAPVGCSEHHTGLAIDINIKANGTWPSDNNELMEQVEHYKAIHKYLADYGFILRYPEGKEDITGYPYEPWHIRYIGKTVAKIIEKENYTLEEYLSDYSGVIVVNKKSNMTSFDVVNEISRTLGIKKIGHTGTLDPLAEGVLVVTVGKATKIAELLTATYKEYQAGVILGVETDTLDITGKIINSKIVSDNLPIEKVLKGFKKTYLQEVPIYSAVKVKGKKLYEYARENKTVELPKKEVTIKEISLLETDRNTFIFKALVSKGCYIRSLIRDIGKSLDTYATMTNLTRTKQGKYTLTDAYTLEDIAAGNFNLLKIEDVLDYPKVVADEKLSFKIKSGQKLKNEYNIKDKVLFIDQNNKLLGIYQVENENFKVWKNFV
jgi:tRNA pseudouridine55 synthase